MVVRTSIALLFSLALFGWVTHPGGSEFATIWNIAVPVLVSVVSAPLYLLSRPMVLADESGLVVRNLIRTTQLEWAQVVAVRFGRDAPCVTLDLSDGSTLNVLAIAAAEGQSARRAAEVLATFAEKGSH